MLSSDSDCNGKGACLQQLFWASWTDGGMMAHFMNNIQMQQWYDIRVYNYNLVTWMSLIYKQKWMNEHDSYIYRNCVISKTN